VQQIAGGGFRALGQFAVASAADRWRPADAANRQMPEGQDPALFERGDQASSPKGPIGPEGV